MPYRDQMKKLGIVHELPNLTRARHHDPYQIRGFKADADIVFYHYR